MTHLTDTRSLLERLAATHRGDGDGGYAHAFAIRDAYRDLADSERIDCLRLLASEVLERGPHWGIDLEALIQIDVVERGDELVAAVQSNAYDPEWRDDVVSALLRLRHAVQGSFYVDYVEEALAQHRQQALPLAAALARMHPEESTNALSSWLVDVHARGEHGSVEGYAPTVVRNYLSADEQLLSNLARKMRERSSKAALWFAGCVEANLRKPWVVKEFGEERTSKILASIVAAAGAAN